MYLKVGFIHSVCFCVHTTSDHHHHFGDSLDMRVEVQIDTLDRVNVHSSGAFERAGSSSFSSVSCGSVLFYGIVVGSRRRQKQRCARPYEVGQGVSAPCNAHGAKQKNISIDGFLFFVFFVCFSTSSAQHGKKACGDYH